MKYKITIEKLEEYDEMETVYEMSGSRYYSKYHDDLEGKAFGKDYCKKVYPTGKKLDRATDIYQQEFEADDIVAVIQAVNGL